MIKKYRESNFNIKNNKKEKKRIKYLIIQKFVK